MNHEKMRKKQQKLMKPIKKVSGALEAAEKKVAKPDYKFFLRACLKGKDTEVHYKKFLLADELDYFIPSDFYHVFIPSLSDAVIEKKRKIAGGHKPKHLFVEGVKTKLHGTKVIVATDFYRAANSKGDDAEYFHDLNSMLCRSYLFYRGFVIIPHWLMGKADGWKKSENNKAVAKAIFKEGKRQGWPVTGVELVNTLTRETKKIL